MTHSLQRNDSLTQVVKLITKLHLRDQLVSLVTYARASVNEVGRIPKVHASTACDSQCIKQQQCIASKG